MNDLISVIVPVYKVEKYLNRCVDSLLNQSYRRLEIILVNDGSPDRSGEICEDYAAMDSRVKVIHKENGGLSSARNAGIDKATGEYLSFLDSDDWVHKEYIYKLYHLLLSTESDIAACNFLELSSKDQKVKEELLDLETIEYSNLEALEQLVGEYGAQLVVACSKLYKRELFNDIRYPLGMVHEDEYIIHHIYYKAEKIVFTTEQLYYYWQHGESIMGEGFSSKKTLDKITAYKNRAQFFEHIGLNSSIDRMNAEIFHLYRQMETHRQTKDNELNKLKKILRKGNHKFKFRLFYECYYLMPGLMNKLYQIIKS